MKLYAIETPSGELYENGSLVLQPTLEHAEALLAGKPTKIPDGSKPVLVSVVREATLY